MNNKIRKVFGVLLGLGLIAASYFYLKPEDVIARVARYPYKTFIQSDLSKDIQLIEQRVAKDSSAFDLATLAGVYLSQGKITGDSLWFQKAEERAKLSLKKLPHPNVSARLVLAKIADSRHDFKEAIRIAKEAYDEDRGRSSALPVMATSYLATGNLEEAGKLAEQYVDRTPGLESYGLRALVMNAQGRDDEALGDFIRALEIEDLGETQESARIRCLFARFLIRKGDYPHGELLLSEALKSFPKYHLAYSLYSELFLRKGDLGKAEKFIKLAFESSKQLTYLTQYSRIALLKGDKSLAHEIQTQAEVMIRSELSTKGYGHRLDLASVLLDRGSAKDIQEALELAAVDVQNRRSAAALFVLARAQLAAGLAKEAMATSREILRTGVKDSDYFYQMSLVQKAVKNLRQAKIYLDQSVKTNPSNFLVIQN